MTFTITKDMVLFALSIYGAVLSTWNLVKAIRKDRRSIKIGAGSKMPYGPSGLGATWAHIEATNVGLRPVTITMIAFELQPGQRMFKMSHSEVPGMDDTNLPITLADGQTARLHQAYAEIGQALAQHGITGKTKITPVCEDSAGGTYRGKAWSVDVQELMRM